MSLRILAWVQDWATWRDEHWLFSYVGVPACLVFGIFLALLGGQLYIRGWLP